MTEPTVVDVSRWQPDVDFQALADSGVLAVILKCTEGSTYTDDSFSSHRDQAVAAGLAYSSYHFLKHGNAPQQMTFYMSVLQPRWGERICIDYEDTDCTLDDLHDAVQEVVRFSNENDRNLQITVYSGHLLKEQLGGDYDTLLAESTSLWLAQYTTGTPSWPGGTYKTWSLWQYTDSETVGGYGPLDGNRFNGSDDDLLAWIGPVGDVSPGPGPWPPPVEITEVELIVRANKPIKLVVVTDGENVIEVDQRDSG